MPVGASVTFALNSRVCNPFKRGSHSIDSHPGTLTILLSNVSAGVMFAARLNSASLPMDPLVRSRLSFRSTRLSCKFSQVEQEEVQATLDHIYHSSASAHPLSL